MGGSVTVRFGNVFDGPSDLLVLPCSTFGTVSDLVAKALADYSLPTPEVDLDLGEVRVLPFEGGENLAQFVAFAASVERGTSSFETIEVIGYCLGEITRENASVRTIHTPLLGVGAGGLEAEVALAALKSGFSTTADPASRLIIHVLDRDDFDALRGGREASRVTDKRILRVFLSHTSTRESDVEWVKKLALYLIDHGIQARLDKFHLRRGMDLPQWMCNELALADKVIVICDKDYKQKADNRLGGVGWETMIIQGDIASLAADSTKYQVVVRADEIAEGLPMYLRSRYVFHARSADRSQVFRDELVRELLDLPLDERLDVTEFFL